MKLPASFSLIAHAVFVLFFAIGARFDPSMTLGGGPGLGDITPVRMLTSEQLQGAVPIAAAEPVAPPVPEPSPFDEPVPIEPPEARETTNIAARPPDLEQEEAPAIKLPDRPKPPSPARKDTTKKAPPRIKPPPPKPPPSPAEAALAGVPEATTSGGRAVTAGIVGDGGPGGGGGFSDFGYYRIAIQNKIGANWSPGFVSGDAACIVYFRVIRSGRIVQARVEESSGIPYYDQTALRAVAEASPLPPLPEQFPDDTVGVHFRFRYQP
jgi:TonB family protein